MILVFLLGIGFQTGCSEDKTTINKDILLNEPRKSGQKGSQQRFSRGIQETEALSLAEQDAKQRKTQMKTVEICQKEFELCIEACRKPDCEDACLEFLASCEKEVPKELQTLKQ